MAEDAKPLLIKRYASRRLYNTETSDYVTLEDIAAFIRDGREVQIVDLKSGDDLTRQYLLQIIAEHESRGESVLPVDVLTELGASHEAKVVSAHRTPDRLVRYDKEAEGRGLEVVIGGAARDGRAIGARVSLRDLLSHRSGLPDHAGDDLEDLGFALDRTVGAVGADE